MPRVGGRRAERENRDEGRNSILRLKRCLDLIDIPAHMARDKFAARHRNQVRRERHANIAAPSLLIKLLLNLRGMAVIANPIGVRAFCRFGEEIAFFQAPARPRHTRLGVDDDAVGIDQCYDW